jgi:hypothetical protein
MAGDLTVLDGNTSPTASRPQAWAAGPPLLALRTALGLDVVDGTLRIDPHLS